MAKCLNPNCENKARVRGLCMNCYGSALNLIKHRLTSWSALEKANKSKPARPVRKSEKVKGWLLGK
jgi:hypothetical protein